MYSLSLLLSKVKLNFILLIPYNFLFLFIVITRVITGSRIIKVIFFLYLLLIINIKINIKYTIYFNYYKGSIRLLLEIVVCLLKNSIKIHVCGKRSLSINESLQNKKFPKSKSSPLLFKKTHIPVTGSISVIAVL